MYYSQTQKRQMDLDCVIAVFSFLRFSVGVSLLVIFHSVETRACGATVPVISLQVNRVTSHVRIGQEQK